MIVTRASLVVLLSAVAVCACLPAPGADGGIVSFVIVSSAGVGLDDPGALPGIVRRVGNLRVRPDFAISLGNNIGSGAEMNPAVDLLAYQAVAGRFPCDHYYAVGDNEWAAVETDDRLTWEDLHKAWRMAGNYYSFDTAGLHVCVLDTALALSLPENAEALAAQERWLEEDLGATELPTVILGQRSVVLQKGDVAHWTQGDQLDFWPADNGLARIIRANAERIIGVFEGDSLRSFLREKNGVLHHQIGAASTAARPEGQFVQVFVDVASGRWFVLGDPETIDQREQYQVQLTYGDRSLLKTLRDAAERRAMRDDPEEMFDRMMLEITAADEWLARELEAVAELERELEAHDRLIDAARAADERR